MRLDKQKESRKEQEPQAKEKQKDIVSAKEDGFRYDYDDSSDVN